MKTFKTFLENRLYSEVAPPPAPGGISAPGALPGGAGAPPPPPPGGGMPPIGGGLSGGMGGMPPMPGAAPAGGTGQAPQKLKATNVWEVLERVLGNS
jgi:hypothetical protein